MANKNALNKNSVYVQSLVDFILDTKPYHSKLTEIVEEYRFFDDVNVKIKERFSSKTKINSTWTYNYFSSANPLYRTMPAQRLVSPSFKAETYVVGQDENKDLAMVPYAYSKKSFDGVGVNQVYIRHEEFVEPLTESVDYFQSHGSFQFQIKQTKNANGDFNPLWASGQDDGSILESRRMTRQLALDTTNPSSATNRIRALLDEIQAAVTETPHAEVQVELDKLYAILDSNDLPQTYEALLAWLAVPNENDVLVNLPEPHDRQWFEQQFSNNSSPLFFGMFTDLGVREDGRVHYDNTESDLLRVSNIVVYPGADIEEWDLSSINDTDDTYRIMGSSTGFIGFVKAGDTFNNGRISFKTTKLGTLVHGDRVELAPTKRVVISPNAPLETWNLIKVNPIAHDRPQLTSNRFGHIVDGVGKIGNVSILDLAIPPGDIVLTSRGNGFFDMMSTAESNYKALIQVGVPYNDGRLAFTIVAGPKPFPKGDRFYIAIENLPARAENFELEYGYDLDPYDDDTSTYPNSPQKLGFYYGSRFTDYDLTAMNLTIAAGATNDRKWRFRALPDYTRPIKDVDALPAGAGNLRIYYADRFAIEFSDNDFKTKTIIGTAPVGSSFNSAQYGISFRIPAASRPFVAVSAFDAPADRVEGGDLFTFEVKNPAPYLVESPVGLSSSTIPRLIMHSDSFFNVPAASWVVEFTDKETYTVSCVVNGAPTISLTAKIPSLGVNELEGYSFKRLGVHFTIVPTGGLAAGDKFTFNTFSTKPSYLVYGSVTGWTAPATVGKYYWNGKIGFKIKAPEVTTFKNNLLVSNYDFTLREDCPSLIYSFEKNPAGWFISRSDTGQSTFSSSTFSDQYLTFDTTQATENFKLVVDAHDYPLWNSADVVILNPRTSSRLPENGAKIVIEKTEDARLSLNLTPSTHNVSALKPITIDQRFINTNTHGIPLSLTSPETALLQGWIPMNIVKQDSTTSVAEFSDPATLYKFSSAASGEAIGQLKQQNASNKMEPIVFEWDESFYTKYLPLNAEANLVISGTGWDDKTAVKITESIKFLLGGGALFEDWLFHDDAHVKIVDTNEFNIQMWGRVTGAPFDVPFDTAGNGGHFVPMVDKVYDKKGNLVSSTPTNWQGDAMSIKVEDGPFGGFLAGYDNTFFDEDGYDVGQPPDLYSMLGKKNLTDEQRADILSQWSFYLENGQPPTTEEQWEYLRNALAADPVPGLVSSMFGYPLMGMGIDITDRPEGEAETSIKEAMTILAVDTGNHLDTQGYGMGKLDELDEITSISYSGSLPPVPDYPQQGATYDSFETPLTIETPARVFEVAFNASPSVLAALSPHFSIWLPNTPAPTQVAVVERISAGVFRFSVPKPTAGKIIVG